MAYLPGKGGTSSAWGAEPQSERAASGVETRGDYSHPLPVEEDGGAKRLVCIAASLLPAPPQFNHAPRVLTGCPALHYIE